MAMAAADAKACSLCLDSLAKPGMVAECGHNFCKPCITRYWKGCFQNVSCPQCQATSPKAKLEENQPLKNGVEVTRRLAARSPPEPPKKPGSLCAVHRQPLELFCPKEGAPLRAICEGGKKGHRVVPIQEAEQELQDKIKGCLEYLNRTRNYAEKCKEAAKGTIKELQIADVKDTLLAEVDQFCQFLKHQVQFLLPHLDVFQAAITKKAEEASSRYTKEVDQLNSVISNIKRAQDQPAAELLKERSQLEGIMSEGKKRCDQFMAEEDKEYESTENYFDGTVQFEENSFGDLEERHVKFVEHNKTVKEILQKFRGEMADALRSARNDILKDYAKATMSFDGDTACELLVLSGDERTVYFDLELKKKKPFQEKRFDQVPCVLGTEAFTEGRYYWEIDVEEESFWGVGVCRESVERKGKVDWLDFAPENGIWAIGYNGKYRAFTGSLYDNHLSMSKPLKKIEVYLDYTAGEVSFVNPDNNALIFTFPPATFGGETIHPWFWVSGGQMSLPWSEDDYPDMEYVVSTGIIKPWEIPEYIGVLPGS